MRLHPATGILATAVLVYVSSLTAVRQSQQRELFRASVDAVELDVIATDRAGQPVLDLSADDVEILEDGRRVEVASFRAIILSSVQTRPMPRMASPSGVAWGDNNRTASGRLLVIVLDAVNRTRFHHVRRTVLALLSHLGPADQVAMLSNGGSPDYHVEFTTDSSRIARALESRAALSGSPDRLLRVLTRLADSLRPIQGRRKVVAVVSEGIPEIARSLDVLAENHVPELREFLRAALQANLAVYAFNPRYASDIDTLVHADTPDARALQMEDEREGNSGLQTIAEATGGRATIRTNMFEADVARMFAENASYYLIAYYSGAPRDGKLHHISLRSRRPGVELRTRSGYVATRVSPSATRDATRADALASAPVQSEGLPLRFVAVGVPSKSRRLTSVHIVTEVHGAQLVGADGLEVKALGVDMTGQVRGTDRFVGRLSAPVRSEDSRWVRVASSVALPPGRHQLRVAVARTDGRAAGSVFDEIAVPDFPDDLALGGLVLGTVGSFGTPAADRILEDLHLLPIATRDVPFHMSIRAAVPLRVGSTHRQETVQFVATLTFGDGSSRELARVERPAAAFAGGSAFDFDLPIRELGPGEYGLRVNVSLGKISAQRETSFRVASPR